MKRKLQNIAYLLMAAALVTSCGGKKQTSEFPDWAWADFQRPEGINPIISPDTTTFFYCPMRQDSVAWEASDTFNPAATVYNGKVVVLYRAEDNSATGIGSRTSRLGYASSDDGLHECPYLYFIRQTIVRKNWKIPAVAKTHVLL